MANESLNAAITEAATSSMSGKKFYESKTFWANVVAASAIALQMNYGFVVTPEIQALALTVINLGLRYITKQPIIW
jgi:hypothetical protein